MRVENYSSYQPYTNKQKNKSLQNKNLINNFDNIYEMNGFWHSRNAQNTVKTYSLE